MSRSPGIPSSLRKEMIELGRRWGEDIPGHVRLMVERFSALLAHAPRESVERTNDIPYGEHERQVLDVFCPSGASAAPVLMFVHGGAFVDGHRNRTSEIYSNVLYYFARNGVVGVNVEYRLAPEFPYPAGSQDVGQAVRWVQANIGRFNGDARRIFLVGHSAGAAHAASYAYDRRLHPAGGPGVAGLVVLSGRVRADTLPENPNAPKVVAYYGGDASLYEDASAVSHVTSQSVATMIAVAEYENPLLDVHCAELFHRLAAAKRRAPRFVWLAGHNHTSMIGHFNTAEDRLGREMLEFIKSGR